MRPRALVNGDAGVFLLLMGTCWRLLAAEPNAPYPGETWPSRAPEQVGLSVAKLPSLDLLVSWNDSPIDDHDRSPGNANTRINQAARLIREAASGSPTESRPGSRTRLGHL